MNESEIKIPIFVLLTITVWRLPPKFLVHVTTVHCQIHVFVDGAKLTLPKVDKFAVTVQ